MNRRTKALQFSQYAIKRIRQRDGECCIFCKAGYHLPDEPTGIFDVMHIVNRSQGGLGIEENGVIGCRYHHMMLDNGNEGLRAEMLEYIEKYMQEQYPGWDKSRLVYKK